MWSKAVREGKESKRNGATKDPGTANGLLFLGKVFKSKVLFHTPLRAPLDLHVFIQHSLTPNVPDCVLGTGLQWETRRKRLLKP